MQLDSNEQKNGLLKLIFFLRNQAYFIFIFSTFLVISVIIWYGVNKEKKVIIVDEKKDTPLIKFYRELNFSGEGFPVDDTNCIALLEKEINKNKEHETALKNLVNRSVNWFSVIEPILKKNNIPEDFKYLPIIESQFTNVVSPRGATGFWQFVSNTASNYGLEINEHIDERYHVEKATEAACKYFKEAYAQFQNWTLVAASYNLGMGGIEQQLKKQNAKTYYELKLNPETKRYIFKILAIKAIINHPDFFGLDVEFKKSGSITNHKKVKIDSSVNNLNSFANNYGLSLYVLKQINPWIIGDQIINPNGKKYFICIPNKDIIQQLNEEFQEDSIDKAKRMEYNSMKNTDTTSDKRIAFRQPAI